MIEWAKKYESPFFYKDSQKALLWYEKAAETGDFFAERRCGEIYSSGTGGIVSDPQKAEMYYTKSANHGDKKAAQILGLNYIDGVNGFPLDIDKGFYWIKKSAEAGYVPGYCTMGWCYQFGKGVSKNLKYAIDWYEKATKSNNSCAMGFLAQLYFEAKGQDGVETDFFKAVEWAEMAIEASKKDYYLVTNAYYVLGYCKLLGKGTSKDYKDAMILLKKATDKGDDKAPFLLGCVYENPSNYRKLDSWETEENVANYEKAFSYYMKAAHLNNAEAQEAVSRCLYNGIGIKEDYDQAEKWHKKAVDNGYIIPKSTNKKSKKSVNSIKNYKENKIEENVYTENKKNVSSDNKKKKPNAVNKRTLLIQVLTFVFVFCFLMFR